MSKDEKLRVVMVETGKAPYDTVIENTLTDMQSVVGGNIECLYLPDECLIAVLNEEGKLIKLTPNRALFDDVLCGKFFIAADDFNGNFRSLSDDEVKRASDMFKNIDIFPEYFKHDDYVCFGMSYFDAESEEPEL